MKPDITRECVKSLYDAKFIKLYDLQYAEGKHYFDATRRNVDDIVAIKSDEEFKKMLPDAVTCAVILVGKGSGVGTKDGELSKDDGSLIKEPKLLLSREFRYPAGRFLLSPPAGLMDPEDKEGYENGLPADEALISTAKREIREETGLVVGPDDRIFVMNQLLFSTPGMTDESNGLVCAVINADDALKNTDTAKASDALDGADSSGESDIKSILTSAGAVGTEVFDGFVLVNEAEAREILKAGRDSYGNYFSVYTWCVLMYFVSGMWK